MKKSALYLCSLSVGQADGRQFSAKPRRKKVCNPELSYHPYSCVTGNTFPSGFSAKACTARALERGYKSEAWGTSKQIEQLNGKVRDGEKGVTVNWVGRTSIAFNAEQLVDPFVFQRTPTGCKPISHIVDPSGIASL